MNKMSDELRLIVSFRLHAAPDRLASAGVGSRETPEDHREAGAGRKTGIGRGIEDGGAPTWLAIDEAQNILPSERRTSATDVIVKYVREGRNYGLSFVVATQQPTAIDPTHPRPGGIR